ncbi:MAG: hypothetical protein QG650_1141 [Patescibacteria group bacterium]|nr:hypothetical protein [Patescibacteria group bacterium]
MGGIRHFYGADAYVLGRSGGNIQLELEVLGSLHFHRCGRGIQLVPNRSDKDPIAEPGGCRFASGPIHHRRCGTGNRGRTDFAPVARIVRIDKRTGNSRLGRRSSVDTGTRTVRTASSSANGRVSGIVPDDRLTHVYRTRSGVFDVAMEFVRPGYAALSFSGYSRRVVSLGIDQFAIRSKRNGYDIVGPVPSRIGGRRILRIIVHLPSRADRRGPVEPRGRGRTVSRISRLVFESDDASLEMVRSRARRSNPTLQSASSVARAVEGESDRRGHGPCRRIGPRTPGTATRSAVIESEHRGRTVSRISRFVLDLLGTSGICRGAASASVVFYSAIGVGGIREGE